MKAHKREEKQMYIIRGEKTSYILYHDNVMITVAIKAASEKALNWNGATTRNY